MTEGLTKVGTNQLQSHSGTKSPRPELLLPLVHRSQSYGTAPPRCLLPECSGVPHAHRECSGLPNPGPHNQALVGSLAMEVADLALAPSRLLERCGLRLPLRQRFSSQQQRGQLPQKHVYDQEHLGTTP